MPRRKPGLSLERHQQIGLELARIADRLTELSVEIGNAYPVNSPVYRLAMRPGPDEALFRLRAALENRMFGEYPDDPRATVQVYFPSQKTRRESHHDQ